MLLCFLPQFLLTPLREGRRGHGGHDINGAAYFYSRPCGRGDVDRLAEVVHEPNFYSRPCGRGDVRVLRGMGRADEISTHAPAGGATKNQGWAACVESISTHAPAGGATRTFQARRSRLCISTHAPAGGATAAVRSCWRTSGHFYSRPCGRGDLHGRDRENGVRQFLLTPLREGRRWVRLPEEADAKYFYSRPCGRGDYG